MPKIISKNDINQFLGNRDPESWPFRGYRKPHGVLFTCSEDQLSSEDVSADFKEVAQYFVGKDASIFFDWLRRSEPLFDKEGNLALHTVEVNAQTLDSIQFPKGGLKSITIDVNNLSKDQLIQFLQMIKQHSLFSIHIKGQPSPEFLKALDQVELILVDDPKLQQLASQISHRNHLRKTLSIHQEDDQALIREWAAIPPNRVEHAGGKLYYLKAHGHEGQAAYALYIENLYKNEKNPEYSNYYRSDKSNWASTFEFYNLINGCIVGMGDLFVETFAQELSSLPKPDKTGIEELVLNQPLNEHMMQQFMEHPLPFKKLNLFISESTVKSPLFPKFLLILNEQGIELLTLTLKDSKEKIEISESWFEGTNYFVRFFTQKYHKPYEGDAALEPNPLHEKIEKQVRQKVQKNNYEHLISKQLKPVMQKAATPKPSDQEKPNQYAENIAIKAYIWGKPEKQLAKDLFHLEVRHVEVELEVQRKVVNQDKVEVHNIIQLQEQQLDQLLTHDSEEELVSYLKFQGQPYYGLGKDALSYINEHETYKVISCEHFANLPMAIKYMTHEAALEVSRNLQAYAVFNLSSLPERFFLEKTAEGELILGFNPHALTSTNTLFTPCALKYHQEEKPLFPGTQLTKEQLWQWNSTDLKHLMLLEKKKQTFKPGIIIKEADKLDESVKSYLIDLLAHEEEVQRKNYFTFDQQQQRSKFILNNFFEDLKEINKLDPVQFACFKVFISHTGLNSEDLKQTLTAFHSFWNEWLSICKKYNLDPICINNGWLLPSRQTPAAYMNTLLTLLRNTPNLKDKLNQWKRDAAIWKGLEAVPAVESRFNQMHLRYGEKGISYFFDQLKSATSNHDGLSTFIFEHYLSALIHWDCLLEDTDFFDALAEVNQFDEVQLNCFKKFIEKTGSSRHDLKKTVLAFQLFWDEWLKLCKEKNIAPARFNRGWQTLEAGNPVVYMERMLTILKNARNLEEQLDDLDGLLLDNYGAYYASKYQGFKHVSKDMQLKFDPKTPNIEPFNLDKSLYRVSLQELAACVRNQDNYVSLWRYMGGCSQGISFIAFHQGVQSLIENNKDIDLSPSLITAALLTNHARYQSSDLLKEALDAALALQKAAPDLHSQLNKKLVELHQLGVFFNAYEGSLICNILLHMHQLNPEKDLELFAGLFEVLKRNPYNTLRCLERLSQHGDIKYSLLPALDLENKLQQQKVIHSQYKDDLLLFSSLFAQAKQYSPEEIAQLTQQLTQAATLKKPNNMDYLFDCLVECKPYYNLTIVLDLFKKVEALEKADKNKVRELVNSTGLAASTQTSKLIRSLDNTTINECKLDLFAELLKINAASKTPQVLIEDYSEEALADNWRLSTEQLSPEKKQDLLFHLKKASVALAFQDPVFISFDKKGLNLSPSFVSCMELKDVARLAEEATLIATALRAIWEEDKVWPVLDWQQFSMQEAHALLTLIVSMLKRPHTPIVQLLIQLKGSLGEAYLQYLQAISQLHEAQAPGAWTDSVIQWTSNKLVSPENLSQKLNRILSGYQKNEPNPLLDLVMTFETPALLESYTLFEHVAPENQQVVAQFLQFLLKKGTLTQVLDSLSPKDKDQALLLQIMARAHTRFRFDLNKKITTDYQALSVLLKEQFNSSDQAILLKQFLTNPPSPDNLFKAVTSYKKTKTTVAQFLTSLELDPFGERTPEMFARQFSASEVERVINGSKDLKNQTRHTYQYRKQWMEAFLFVNQIGQNLPVYNKKAAKDLSNKEIQDLFQDIKHKRGIFAKLSPFMCQLYALGLMREAMYRSTGQFPYSTQILALIDSMMHPGNVISGIATGQGKSLIDTMKASLLWLTCDRVDLITDSTVNAQRDLTIYKPYLTMLDIPCAEQVITPKSSQKDYCYKGINFSSGSMLALFRSKLAILGLMEPDDIVATVINETDQLALDDRRIYRYSGSSPLLKENEEWIYEEIYAFILTEAFKNKNNTLNTDYLLLKDHLKKQAPFYQANPAIVDDISKEQLIIWIESAVKIEYVLKKDFDYVICEEPVVQQIHGRTQLTKSIQILTKYDDGFGHTITGRINPEVSYGEGMQQLLYAKLNRDRKKKEFILEPETKTLISSNNKNFIDYYRNRKKKGLIWGSTGTPGSFEEISELFSKYGFDFSSIKSHHKSQLKTHGLKLLSTEEKQFAAIIAQLKKAKTPSMVFFKDIKTALKFEEAIKNLGLTTQTFFGPGDEAKVVAKAAEKNMITITTNAIGRNANVLYDKEGMDIYHTYFDKLRGEKQKTGRGGRQGAKGNVYYFLNKNDYNDQEIHTIRTQVHDLEKAEREFQEELFDILSVLLTAAHQLKESDFDETSKSLFIKDKLSKWTHDLEATYRMQQANQSYNKEGFTNDAIKSFYRLFEGRVLKQIEFKRPDGTSEFASALPTETMLKERLPQGHKAQETYPVYQKKLTLAECTPPEMIAYGCLNATPDSLAPINTEVVRQKLTAIFTAVQKGKRVSDVHLDYLSYLNQNESNLTEIRKVHAEFLDVFIQDQIENTRKSAFSKFWNSAAGGLSRMTDNRNYLLLFQGLAATSAQEPLLKADTLKKAIIALLDEYLNDSWFVSSDRILSVKELKKALEVPENTVSDLLQILSKHRMKVLEVDIETNKNRFWQLNFFGSRFQDTIDKALVLGQALTGKQPEESVVTDLYDKLKVLIKPEQKPPLFEKFKTFDAFHSEMCQLSVPRWGTTAVVRRSLDRAMEMTRNTDALGRVGLFGKEDGLPERLGEKSGDKLGEEESPHYAPRSTS